MTQKEISERAKAICKLISEGHSVIDACEKVGISDDVFWQEKSACEKLDAAYHRAREMRADARFEKVDKLANDIEDGITDAQRGRVLLEIRKFQVSKERPKIYGDATIIRGDKDNPIEIGLSNALESAMMRRQAIAAPDIIEGETVPVIEIKKAEDYI